jgi:hypothetical protein
MKTTSRLARLDYAKYQTYNTCDQINYGNDPEFMVGCPRWKCLLKKFNRTPSNIRSNGDINFVYSCSPMVRWHYVNLPCYLGVLNSFTDLEPILSDKFDAYKVILYELIKYNHLKNQIELIMHIGWRYEKYTAIDAWRLYHNTTRPISINSRHEISLLLIQKHTYIKKNDGKIFSTPWFEDGFVRHRIENYYGYHDGVDNVYLKMKSTNLLNFVRNVTLHLAMEKTKRNSRHYPIPSEIIFETEFSRYVKKMISIELGNKYYDRKKMFQVPSLYQLSNHLVKNYFLGCKVYLEQIPHAYFDPPNFSKLKFKELEKDEERLFQYGDY